MASTGALDTGIARKLSAALHPLLDSLNGRVVHVGRPLDVVYPATASVEYRRGTDGLPNGELAAVVFVAELCQPRWTPDAIAALAQRLAPDGRVLFAEPVAGLGPSQLAQRALDRLATRRWGYGFTRDIPAELRTAGMTVTSVERIFVDPAPTVFTFAVGDARFYERS
ncbi:MAG: hypothetical protein R2706_04560 [Acidimicrobiales bacterium]